MSSSFLIMMIENILPSGGIPSSVRGLITTISGLANIEWNVAIFDHVLDLSSHCPSQQLSPTQGELKGGMGGVLVKKNKINQYITNTGQNTGISKTLNHEHTKEITIARVAECQNLNSGKRRIKGRNSSSCLMGRDELPASPSSRPSSCVRDGSNFGERKARKRLRR